MLVTEGQRMYNLLPKAGETNNRAERLGGGRRLEEGAGITLY